MAVLLGMAIAAAPQVVRSQTIIPAADGTGTHVIFDGQTYWISGGSQAASNLFHSFQQFGLDSGQIAQFLAAPQLRNILARVSGGSPSYLDGTLAVSGGSPHLYLMNPAGIVFGPNANLNVPGDFFATTADRIGFDGGGWFNASGPNDYASLISAPNQFAFLSSQPGAIVNSGNLVVEPGNNLGLFGGTVVNQGVVAAPGGQVTLAAVPGENLVRISQPGMLLSLEVPAAAVAEGIRPVDLPALLTGGGLPAVQPGDVAIHGLVGGDRVHLAAAGRVRPSDPALIRTDDGRSSAPTVTRYAATADAPLALVALDTTVPDYTTLLYGGRPGTTTIAITPEESGIATISQHLAARREVGQPVDEVHLVSEGNAGNFWLGRDFLAADTIGDYRESLQSWRGALSENADILLYSCFTALGLAGEALVGALAAETGADVAASTDRTGSAALGGNWHWERTLGSLEADLAFESPTLDQYRDTLDLFTVTTGEAAADSSAIAGSLRWAIVEANNATSDDEIRFAPNVAQVNLTAGSLAINATSGDLFINGQGRNVVIQGNNTARLFNIITGFGDVTFDSLTLTGGSTAGDGGAIRNPSNTSIVTIRNSQILGNSAGQGGGAVYGMGVLNLSNTLISNNQAQQGGGVYNKGIANLTRTTLSNNQASQGGGFYHAASSTANINNSTLSSNQAASGGGFFSGAGSIANFRNATIANNIASSGGGLHADGAAAVNLSSSIVASNATATGQASDLSGGNLNGNDRNLLSSLAGKTSGSLGTGSDWVVADPGLTPLGNYGGPTPTHALLPNSPALDRGYNAAGLGQDQRGLARVQGSAADIGAYESARFQLEILGGDRQIAFANTPFSQNLQLRLTEIGFGRPLPNAPVTFTLPASGASAIASSFNVFTDANGIARLELRANPFPGNYTIQASASPSVQAEFALTNAGGNFGALLPPLQSGFVGDFALSSWSEELETATDEEVEALDTGLAAAFADYFGLEGDRAVSLAAIRRQLQEVEARTGLRPGILYAVFRPAETGPWGSPGTTPEPQPSDILELTLVTAVGDTVQIAVPAARRDRVAKLTSRLRRSVTNRARDRGAYLPPAQQLYDWLIAPLAGDLQRLQVNSLVWIPDTGLRSLPLAALHDGEQFLVERYSLGLLPSLALADLDYRPLENATVLAMGADRFAEQQPLPGVPLEIEAIANQLWSGRVFLNERFTLANFKTARASENFRIVHLATHGEFRPGRPKNSYIQFWDNKLTLDRLSELGLQQPPVDLLVLSACRTALGDPEAELGFAGLAVAAGVKSALGSLWYVNDEGTLALMTRFYTQLRAAPLVSVALQQAQVAMLRGELYLDGDELVTPTGRWPLPPELQALGDRDFSHPYYWSAFTLIGSPW